MIFPQFFKVLGGFMVWLVQLNPSFKTLLQWEVNQEQDPTKTQLFFKLWTNTTLNLPIKADSTEFNVQNSEIPAFQTFNLLLQNGCKPVQSQIANSDYLEKNPHPKLN